jgi:hypothetical protein
MASIPKSFFQYRLLPLMLFIILLASCGAKDQVAGNYRAEGQNQSGEIETVLDLKPNGEGSWKSGGEEIPFAWYLKGADLRINTKGGGVIVGDLEGDTIRLTLPGNKKMTFRKIR